jgi:hypothetical protein
VDIQDAQQRSEIHVVHYIIPFICHWNDRVTGEWLGPDAELFLGKIVGTRGGMSTSCCGFGLCNRCLFGLFVLLYTFDCWIYCYHEITI